MTTQELDLTTIVAHTAESYWDTHQALGHFEAKWAELPPMEQNSIKETITPFIHHSISALETAGFVQEQLIYTEESLADLPSGSMVLDFNQQLKLKTPNQWMLVDAYGAIEDTVALPAVLKHAPKAAK